MDRKTESPRFILILGSLFLMAYAAFMLGAAWMDSVSVESISAIEMSASTPTPSNLTPTITPTNIPLYWITPTNTLGVSIAEEQVTSTPDNVNPTPTRDDDNTTPEGTPAAPTATPPNDLPTSTPANNPTSTPTGDAYPGPGETDAPYPGPEGTSTPMPTFAATSTGNPAQPNPTLAPSLTLQPTNPARAPTPSATSVLPAPTSPPITTLAYSETLVLSDGAVNQVIWSQDALTLTLATSDGLYLVDADTLLRERILDKGASILSVAYAFNDDLLATGGGDAAIRWWNPVNGSYMGFLQEHLLGVMRLGLPDFGNFLASGSDDATVRVWDISTLYNLGVGSVRLMFTFYEPHNRVTDMAVSGIGEMVAASSNQHVHVWNPLNGDLMHTISQPSGWYTAVAFSPDSQTLATAYDGRRLEFWDTLTWERTKFLPLDGPVQVLSYSSDGNLLAVGLEDGRIQIWNARSKLLLADLPGHGGLTSMAFSPFGDQLVTSSSDGTIRLWDAASLRNP